MMESRNTKIDSLGYVPQYELDTTTGNIPYFRSSQGLEHQSSMLGALSGVPFLGKVASGYQKAVNAQIDRQFQEYMARLGFDFSNEQREKQNLYNYWVAQEFMDKQNQWNSYANQVAEMKRAGLNPAGIFGEGQLTGNNSSQSAPTGGAPSGSATGIGYQSQTAVGDMSEMADFASAIKSISDAKLSDQQRADLLATATDRYKEIKENADKATYERQLAGMNAWILSEYGGKMKEADLKHMDALTQNLLAAAGLAIAQTGVANEEEKKKMHEAWQAYMDWLERNRMYDAKLKLNYWYESVQNDIEQQEAETKKTIQEGNAAQAQGEAAKQNAATTAAVGASQVEANKATADLSRAQKKVQESIDELNKLDIRNKKSWSYKLRQFNENLHAAMRENLYTEQQKYELGIVRQRLKMAIKANDTYMISLLTGQVSAIMGSAAAGVKAAK